jgi:hypothetical protein
LPYAKVPHATIKARTIAAIPIVNQKSRWRPVPSAAFHDLLGCPSRYWMPRHFSVEDFSVGVPNHEEDVKRLEQDRSDAEKIASPNGRCVALWELSPTGAWAPVVPDAHIRRHGSGGNLETQPCLLGLDPFLAPQRIFRGHAPRDRRATAPRPARRSSRPVGPPAQSLPT